MEPIDETRDVLNQLLSEGRTEIATTVLQMGRRARRIVPELVGLSLGVLDDGLTFTLAATDDEVAAMDAVQYIDGGPCVAGAHDGETIEVQMMELTDETRWRMFASASAAAGIASSLTLPIHLHGNIVGTINLYASTSDAFNGKHEDLADVLGASAEGAVANADLSFATRLEAMQAPERYAYQNDIDIALGLIITQQNVDFVMARERLHAAAARAGTTEGQAARALINVLAV